MALKQIRVAAPVAQAPDKKSKVPVIQVSTDLVSRYVQADMDAKAAAAALAELKPLVEELGREKYFSHRATGAVTSSIKLEDTFGAVASFQFKDQYKAVDAAAAESLFEGLGKDINNYAQQEVSVSFDNKVFFDANGDFQEERYTAFMSAIATVSARFGVVNPLTSKIQVKPKPSFHEKRFVDFTAAQNAVISQVLGNTTALKAENPAMRPLGEEEI